MNSVSDIYGPDEIEELLEDLNRLEMASFDGVMMFDQASMPGGGNGPDGDRDDLSQDRMRPTSSEINMMQNEAVISGCITQPPDDDVEDFDIDGSQVGFWGQIGPSVSEIGSVWVSLGQFGSVWVSLGQVGIISGTKFRLNQKKNESCTYLIK